MDPADGGMLCRDRPAAPQATLEGVDGHLEMGVGMPVDAQRLTDMNLDAKLLAQLSTQASPGRLAGPALASRKLPQTSEQAPLRTPADQHAPTASQHAGRGNSLRDRFAASRDGSEILDAAQARPTPASDRAETAARFARQAHLRPQIHQRLIEVGRPAARQMTLRPSVDPGFTLTLSRVELKIGQARDDPPQIPVQGDFVPSESERSDGRRRV